jgi:chromosome partitioning protein
MIVTIGGTKGGTGKSTLAANFAALASRSLGDRGRVLLIDADPQGTAAEFAAVRADTLGRTGFTAVKLDHKGLMTQLPALGAQYDVIFIDVAGADTMAQRAALIHSGRLIAPFLPSSPDLWTLGRLLEVVNEVRQVNEKLQLYGLLNRCTPRLRDTDAASELLTSHEGLNLLTARIVQRVAISDAFSDGLAVDELRPYDTKACAEMALAFTEATGLRVTLRIALGALA